jgi:hypothetical protein
MQWQHQHNVQVLSQYIRRTIIINIQQSPIYQNLKEIEIH